MTLRKIINWLNNKDEPRVEPIAPPEPPHEKHELTASSMTPEKLDEMRKRVKCGPTIGEHGPELLTVRAAQDCHAGFQVGPTISDAYQVAGTLAVVNEMLNIMTPTTPDPFTGGDFGGGGSSSDW